MGTHVDFNLLGVFRPRKFLQPQATFRTLTLLFRQFADLFFCGQMGIILARVALASWLLSSGFLGLILVSALLVALIARTAFFRFAAEQLPLTQTQFGLQVGYLLLEFLFPLPSTLMLRLVVPNLLPQIRVLGLQRTSFTGNPGLTRRQIAGAPAK